VSIWTGTGQKWRPGVVAQHRAVLSRPGEVELGGVSHAEQSVVVGEEDATQGQASSGLQLGDGGVRRDAEERDVDGSDGLSALHADVGARVVHDKVAQGERAVGCNGQAARLVWVRSHPPLADLLSVPARVALVEGPGDGWAAEGDHADALQ